MGILNGPFIRSRKLRVRGGREVDLGFGAVVEVVRKDAQSHVRHDFVDLAVAVTGPTHVVHIGICDSPPLIDQLASKGQCFCAFVVRCQAMPSLSQFCHTQADLLADSRDREKLLTRLRRECDSVFRDIVMVSTLDARGADALDAALATLITVVRNRRASSALRVIGRISHRALAQMQEP